MAVGTSDIVSYWLSSQFSRECWRFTDSQHPAHQTLTPSWLKAQVGNLVRNITGSQVGVILFAWFPGIGKTAKLKDMYDISVRALGWPWDRYIAYTHPDGGWDTFAGSICPDGIVATVHGDHMFRAIGSDRRGTMLESQERFAHLWADDDKLGRVCESIVSWKASEERLYRGTMREKTAREPLGRLKLLNQTPQEGKRVIIVEWVQAIQSLDAISLALQGEYSLKVMKILFDVSLLDSAIRVMRRDHDNKKLSFAQVLHPRLLEYPYIFDTFMKPALMDRETVFFDKPRDMPPFTHIERDEILALLRDYIIPLEHRADPWRVKFIYELVARLKEYFGSIRSVSDEEFSTWKGRRDERKRRLLEVLS